jgi:hypothetical protein
MTREDIDRIASEYFNDKESEHEMDEVFDLAKKALEKQMQARHWKDFALWVATEIFDDMWEYNYDGFTEIACRKLAKLGIVVRMGDEWVLVELQERSDKE